MEKKKLHLICDVKIKRNLSVKAQQATLVLQGRLLTACQTLEWMECQFYVVAVVWPV